MATTAKRVKDNETVGKPNTKKCPTCRGTGKVEGKNCPDCPKSAGRIFTTRRHNRCRLCGRPRGILRKFSICRLCFRQLALRGEVPGVSKSSW